MEEKEKLEIIRNILRIVKLQNNSITKKSLFRKINIEKTLFDKIFKELDEKKFIRIVGKAVSGKFGLTDKGFGYLERYDSMVRFIEDFRL